MTVRVRTDLGGEFARKVAELEVGREVSISCVFIVPERPGAHDWIFSSGGDRDDTTSITMMREDIHAAA